MPSRPSIDPTRFAFALLLGLLLGLVIPRSGLASTSSDKGHEAAQESRASRSQARQQQQGRPGQALDHRVFFPQVLRGHRQVVTPIGHFGGELGPRLWHAGSLYSVVGDRIEVHRPSDGAGLEPVDDVELPGRDVLDLRVAEDRLFVRYVDAQHDPGAGLDLRQWIRTYAIDSDGRLTPLATQSLPDDHRWSDLIPLDGHLALARATPRGPADDKSGPPRLLLLDLGTDTAVEILDVIDLPTGFAGDLQLAFDRDRLALLLPSPPCAMRCPTPRSLLIALRIADAARFEEVAMVERAMASTIAIDGDLILVVQPSWFVEPARILAYDRDPSDLLRERGSWPLAYGVSQVWSVRSLAPGLLALLTGDGSLDIVTFDLDTGPRLSARLDLGIELGFGRLPDQGSGSQAGSGWILASEDLLLVDLTDPAQPRILQHWPLDLEPVHPYYAGSEGRSIVVDETIYALKDRHLEAIDLGTPEDRLRRRRGSDLPLPGFGSHIAASDRDLFVHVRGTQDAPRSTILVIEPRSRADGSPRIRDQIELPAQYGSRLRVSQGRLSSIEYAPRVTEVAGLRIFDLEPEVPVELRFIPGDMIDALLLGSRAYVLHETGVQDRSLVLEVFDLSLPDAPSIGPPIELHRYSAAGELETRPGNSWLAASGGEIYVGLESSQPPLLLRYSAGEDGLTRADPPALGGACRTRDEMPVLRIVGDRLYCAQSGVVDAWQLRPDDAPQFLHSHRPSWLDPSRPAGYSIRLDAFWVGPERVYTASDAGIYVYPLE